MPRDPSLKGPVIGGSHGFAFGASTIPLADLGYVEDEYFLSGTATAYAHDTPLAEDGRWNVHAVSHTAYTTRLLVRRPARDYFNGVALVEWLNVTAGYDLGPLWASCAEHLLREGYAWVGVSAQAIGLHGFSPDNPFGNAGALKIWDPERYDSLTHPGDSYSYDIFSQAGAAVRKHDGTGPLGNLEPSAIIATGASQSGMRLNTYINAVHPVAQVYDGFLVNVGFGVGAPLSETPLTDITVPMPTFLRTDLSQPILDVETETELLIGQVFLARQPDTEVFRRWETAGAAHGSLRLLAVMSADTTRAVPPPAAALGGDVTDFLSCAQPPNQGPQTYVLNAAIEGLSRWISSGVPAPAAAPLEVIAGPPISLTLDEVGNARGGVRSTLVDVPIAVYSGGGNTAPCAPLFGSTVPLDKSTLLALYPTHQAYVEKVAAAAGKLVGERFLLRSDAVSLVVEAARSMLGY